MQRVATSAGLPRWIYIPAAVGALFVVVPLIAVAAKVDWPHFWSLITSKSSTTALMLSLETAAASTALCVLLGVPMALVLARSNARLVRLARSLILLPLVFLAIGGIPLPGGAVWINRGALRSRATSTWVSLAGPLSNLAIGVAISLIVSLVTMPAGLLIGLSYLALLQIVTFILNILPVPGLDGYGAIEPYLSPQARELGAKARPWAPLILFACLFALPGASALLWNAAFALFNAVGGSGYAAQVGQYVVMFWR